MHNTKDNNMKLNVIEQHEGPFQSPSKLKLLISVMSVKGNETKTSPDINIKNLAVIRFQFRLTEEPGERQKQPIACSMSFLKHSSVSANEIKISVTCKNYSEQWMCTSNWSTWNEIAKQPCSNIDIRRPYVFNHIFEIHVSVCAIMPNMFAKLYDDKDFTDFRLSSGEGSVDVHKACLASHSDTFKTMFANGWKESECRIEPDGVTMQTLQHLKDYLYLGTLQDSSLRQLVLIAKHYKMRNLQAECAFLLAQKVTSMDLFDLLEFARENEIRELTLALIEFTPIGVVESISQSLRQPIL